MSNPTVPLQEFCRIIQGGGHGLSGNDFVPDGYPAYGAGGLNGFLPSYEFDEPAVILSAIGARCGKCFYAEGKWTSLANTQVIFPDRDRADPKFLWYQLNDERRWHRSGTGQPFIKPADVKSHRVFLPPLPEQRRIAEILDKADALRAKRRAALAQLDTLTQSIFLDMFGDPAKNPKGMRKQSLGQLIKLRSGAFLPASEMASSGEYTVLGGNGVSGYHDRYMFEEPQIVIGRVGVYCGCVHVSPPKSWITDNALYVSEHDTALSFDYLVHALIHARLNQYASQFGQPLVSGSRIYPVEILVPPEDLQREFASRVRKADELAGRYKSSSIAFDLLFASLQQRAFGGEL